MPLGALYTLAVRLQARCKLPGCYGCTRAAVAPVELAMPASAFVRGPRSPAPPGSYSGVGWPSSGAHGLAESHKNRSVRLIMMQEKREMLNIAAILTVSMSSRCRQLISAIIIATVSTSGAAARRGCPQRARLMFRTVSEIRAHIGRWLHLDEHPGFR